MMVREAVDEDLDGLLTLYTELNDNPYPTVDENVLRIWNDILNNRFHHVIVAEDGERLVSTCEVIIVPNLTREQKPFAFVENVVTSSGYRKKGYGTAVLSFAKKIAEENDCHKIMLMTGHKDEPTVRFYESNGYNMEDKIGFVLWLNRKD